MTRRQLAVLGLVMALALPAARVGAQEVLVQLQDGPLEPEPPERIFQSVTCEAWSWNPDPFGPQMELDFELTLLVNDQVVATNRGQGVNYAYALVGTTFEIGRESVEVKCTNGLTWAAPLTFPGREPAQVNVYQESPLLWFSHGSYLLIRIYQVIDTYGLRFAYSDTTVSESMVPVANGCGIEVYHANVVNLSSENALFSDSYGDLGDGPIPACGQVPTCRSTFQQTHWLSWGTWKVFGFPVRVPGRGGNSAGPPG